jgi:hypothetical protein
MNEPSIENWNLNVLVIMRNCLNVFVEIMTAFGPFAWPITVIGLVFWFRKNIHDVIDAIKRQILLGASIKYGELELTGKKIENFPLTSGTEYERVEADQKIMAARDQKYKSVKNIFLVHRSKKTENIHEQSGLPVYEVSVYLIGHKNYGALNDVKKVEYYLGKYFGRSVSKNGAKYMVSNSANGFAIRVTAYGPTLCEARLIFHDGSEAQVDRYLDFEGTGYVFDPNTK